MDEDDADLSSSPRTKVSVIVVVALLHIGLGLGLIYGFAPDFTARAVEKVVSTFTVTITAPPKPEPPEAPKPAGAAAEAGKKAVPREVRAERPKVAIAKVPAPRASSSGSADTSGARDAGPDTGAGGQGSGTGGGAGGSGQGGGAVTKAVHTSGQINNARDFPIPEGGREARVGKSVILALTISPEGRAVGCRIYRPSGLPETDEVTCRLAKERLRFKPATNAAGEPVTSTFHWQQKFFF